MKTTLADFDTDLTELKIRERENDYIEQNHFGDFLMIEENEDNERYRVWLNNPENVAQGEPTHQIEYLGSENGYNWEDVTEDNK